MSERSKYLLLLFILAGVIIFFTMGERDLWEPDETRYAVIAREMAWNGNWIVPRLNGQIYTEKPPLFFWLINLSTFFFGPKRELAVRLPSAVAGLTMILLTFVFGNRLFGPRAGFFSGLILASSLLFPHLSRWVILDPLFALLFILSLYCLFLGYENEEKRRNYYLLGGLCAGLGVLTKGPIGYLSIVIILLFGSLQKERERVWNRKLLFAGFLSIAIVLAWFIPACLTGGADYTRRILVQQTAGRFIGVGRHIHSQSIFFYLVRFPIGFLPWSLFLPSAFFHGMRRMRDCRREMTLLFLWFGFIFLFFSFSKGKKDTYLLPLYPAAALLTGFLWDSEILSGRLRRGMIAGLTLLAVCLLAALVLIPLRTPEGIYGVIQPVVHLIKPILICFSLGSLIALLLYLRDRKAISFLCLFATLLALHLQIARALPIFNSLWSMKAFSEKIVRRMEPGDKLRAYKSCPTGLLYYTQMNSIERIDDKNRFIEILSSPERTYVMTEQRHLDPLRKELGIDFRIIDRARVKWWDLVLISNFKAGREARKGRCASSGLHRPSTGHRTNLTHSQLLLLFLVLCLAEKRSVAVSAPTEAAITTFPAVITQRGKRAPVQEVFPAKGKNAHLKGRGEVVRGSK